MNKYLTLLLVASFIYGQDKIKYDGKELEGKYIEHNDDIIKFHFKGSKTHSIIPFDLQRLEYIILKDGTVIGQDKIKYDGKELEGIYIEHNDDIIKFHFKGSKTHSIIPFDIQRLEYIIKGDGTNIDIDSPLIIVEQEKKDKKLSDDRQLDDVMILGTIDDDKNNSKVRTYKRVGQDLYVYGKYRKIEYSNAKIMFYGNDGKLWDDPTDVKKIKSFFGKEYVSDEVLKELRKKRDSILNKISEKSCEKNKNIKILVMPFIQDYYGLLKDIEDYLSVQLCYEIVDSKVGLEKMYESNISMKELNDYHLVNIGKSMNVDYVIYGYTYRYDVPFNYSSIDDPEYVKPEGYKDYFGSFLYSMRAWSVYNTELTRRSIAASEVGSYVGLTYYAINIKTGEKLFILKNSTVLKLN